MLSDPLCDSVNRRLKLAILFLITNVKKIDMSIFSNVKNISKCKKGYCNHVYKWKQINCMTVHIFTNVNKVTGNYYHHLYIWIINYKMTIALAVFNWLKTHLQWKKVKPGGGDRISWIIHPD